MPKGYASDQKDVLLAIYGYFLTVDGSAFFLPQELQYATKLKLSSSYIALILAGLLAENFVEDNGYDADDEAIRYTMTKAGVIKAEEEVISRGQTLDEFEMEIRRSADSGLIVSTDHPFIRDAISAIVDLENHLREDNDVGSLTADDRDIARYEVAELRTAIEKPKIRTHYLRSKAKEVLLWIIEKGAGSMISEIAKRVFTQIHEFINIFFN